MQMCLQVLPLLLVHDTSIGLLQYQGWALSANCSGSAAVRENSPCRGEVCCHCNPCRWQSQPLYTCTRDHLKRREGAGTQKDMRPELTGTTIPMHRGCHCLTSAHQPMLPMLTGLRDFQRQQPAQENQRLDFAPNFNCLLLLQLPHLGTAGGNEKATPNLSSPEHLDWCR